MCIRDSTHTDRELEVSVCVTDRHGHVLCGRQSVNEFTVFDDTGRCRRQKLAAVWTARRHVDGVVQVVEVGHGQLGCCCGTVSTAYTRIQTTALTTGACPSPPTTHTHSVHRQLLTDRQTDSATVSDVMSSGPTSVGLRTWHCQSMQRIWSEWQLQKHRPMLS